MYCKEITILSNKKIYYDYEIKKIYYAGIVLKGWEVKSIRNKKFQIINSYAIIRNYEVFIIGMLINPLYNNEKYETERTRKLLLKSLEISKLIGKVERSGYSLVPLDLHFLNGYIKINIGLGKGKKRHDKRASIKEKEWKKEEQRIMKQKLLNK